MTLWLVFLACFGIALALSALLARLLREHRPVALVLAGGLVVDLLVGKRGAWGFADALNGGPHVGVHRALYHLATALQSAWPAALAVLAWWVFNRRPIVLACGVPWAAINLALILRYPSSPEAAQRALLVNEWVALVLAGVVLGRTWGRVRLAPPHHAVRMLLAVELVVATVGPFRKDIFADWDLARFAYTLGFVALAGASVLWLRRPAR